VVVGPSVVVRGGAGGAPTGSCLLHGGTDNGEGGGEVLEGPRECGVRVADGKGDELHPSPLLPAAMRGVFFVIFLDFDVAAEFHAEADFNDDEDALSHVERVRVCKGRDRDPSYVDEV